MLSTGEWIRNKRLERMRSELATINPRLPVFTQQEAPIQGNLNVGSVRSIRQTGSSKFRNLASVYTDIVGFRTGDQLSKLESFNSTTGFSRNIPVVAVTKICTCEVSSAKKVGLCPTCR
jgi:hypothetical protein